MMMAMTNAETTTDKDTEALTLSRAAANGPRRTQWRFS